MAFYLTKTDYKAMSRLHTKLTYLLNVAPHTSLEMKLDVETRRSKKKWMKRKNKLSGQSFFLNLGRTNSISLQWFHRRFQGTSVQ
jgi:hypothetical protein